MRYVVALVLLGIMIFTVVDILLIERSRVRALPRAVWILIGLVPIIGTLLWFLVGRIRSDAGGQQRGARRGPPAPDDDPAFLAQLQREQQQRDRIRELEEQLAELDDEPDSPDEPKA